jgi:hypothetical protein
MKLKFITDELPKENEVAIEGLLTRYSQQDDDSDGYQDIEFSTGDKGGGKYFIIKTERWAFDTIDEFIQLLQDFKKRSSLDDAEKEEKGK